MLQLTARPYRRELTMPASPMGVLEIAALLDVNVRTAHMWNYRDKLPPAEYLAVNGSKAWERATIIRWAGDTGRIRAGREDLHAEFRGLTGCNPIKERHGGRLSAPVPKPSRAKAKAKKVARARQL